MKKSFLGPVLVIGYGNFDRQDDGVAWHVLTRLAARLGISIPAAPEDSDLGHGEWGDLSFHLQLFPELAEILEAYSRVCFVDAHTGGIPGDIHLEEILPQIEFSPFTHHLTPRALLALTQTLYARSPKAILISIRGYEFGFSQQLSPSTQSLVDPAVERILTWLNS
jgi:hydrogenase maturation protease